MYSNKYKHAWYWLSNFVDEIFKCYNFEKAKIDLLSKSMACGKCEVKRMHIIIIQLYRVLGPVFYINIQLNITYLTLH